MDLWDPDFCKLLHVPIPEEVHSLVNEVPQSAGTHVSHVHEPNCVIQQTGLENSTLPANSSAQLLPVWQVVQPELPFSIPLCSPHACNALPVAVPLNKSSPPTKGTNLEPPAKKPRFATPLSSSEMAMNCQPSVPKSTQQNTTWAVGLFNQWVQNRNEMTVEKCPSDLLTIRYPTPIVDYWLAAFILEARRRDGEFYPGNTVRNILAAIFRAMKANMGAINVPNFIDKKQQEMYFPQLHNALDRHLKMLRSKGVGVAHKRAEVISLEMENKFWSTGIVGFQSPKALLNAIFYYNGKNFMLRGVQEHQTLRFSQIVRGYQPDKYTYYEHGSKNHQGGVSDTSDGKVVTIVRRPNHSRCHVVLLDFYLSKVPSECITNDSKFYLQPLPFTPTGSRPWFYTDPVGVVKLKTIVKDICRDSGFQGNFTNHSLRATGATTLFDAGVPEAIIQKRSGHKSTAALRMYERVTSEQELAVSNILQSQEKVTYSQSAKEVEFDPDASFSTEDLELFDDIYC